MVLMVILKWLNQSRLLINKKDIENIIHYLLLNADLDHWAQIKVLVDVVLDRNSVGSMATNHRLNFQGRISNNGSKI